MSICEKTKVANYPHHWECIETNGHKRCTCSPNDARCEAKQCMLIDGSRRVPDGSIISKDHIEAGGLAFTSYNPNTGITSWVNFEKK